MDLYLLYLYKYRSSYIKLVLYPIITIYPMISSRSTHQNLPENWRRLHSRSPRRECWTSRSDCPQGDRSGKDGSTARILHLEIWFSIDTFSNSWLTNLGCKKKQTFWRLLYRKKILGSQKKMDDSWTFPSRQKNGSAMWG